jgi:hypothetical protein
MAEVTGRAVDSFPPPILEQMIRLMRRELRQGLRIDYDEPHQLVDLYVRAGGQSVPVR